MTVKDWTDLAQSIITSLALLGAGYLAFRRWLKRWVAGIAKDSREAAEQLRTSNGTTVAQYVEQMDGKLNAVNTLAQDTSRRLDAVAALAQENSRRLDEHLLRGHDLDAKPLS